MDDAVRVRNAANKALEEIDPPRLRAVLCDQLETASMAPGVLVLLSATLRDPAAEPTNITQRAAGVQLIYEGLRLTRSLAHDAPWERDDAPLETDLAADLDILAADVFVSRGFYLLAQTEAAIAAVETVQAFGREQTHRLAGDDATTETPLEANVFGLAVHAGLTAVGSEPTDEMLTYAAAVGRAHDGTLPPAAAALTEPLRHKLTELSPNTDEAVASSASDS